MLARIILATQAFELAGYFALGAWLRARHGLPWPVVAAGVAGLVLGVRLILVGASFAIASMRHSPREPAHRLGAVATIVMVLREWRAFLLLNLAHVPWERWLLRPDPMPAPSDRPAVVLVHGYFVNRGCFRPLVRDLEAAGVAPLFTPNLRSWLAPIEDMERDLAAEVERVAKATGRKVIVVAHSMGGLAARALLARRGTAHVARLVTIASPHHGTALAYFGIGPSARQMRPHSDFLRALVAAEDGHGPGIPVTSIHSVHDNLVAPQDTSRLPWARDVVMSGVGHVDILGSPELSRRVREELRAGGALPA
jgi:pimeloyl-ACP methyl ester carboxylesterase